MMVVRATEDEHGIVSVYEGERLTMFMYRREWDTLRESLSLPPYEPEPVVSGGGVMFGITRSEEP